MNKQQMATRLRIMLTLCISVWSFIILPAIPAYSVSALPISVAAPDDSHTSRDLAGLASQTGSLLTTGNSSLSGMAQDRLRSMVSGAASSELEQWLSGAGNARVRIEADRNFSLKNSGLDFLLPLYENPDWLLFSQQGIHRTDERTQMNLGAGFRHFGPEWMSGVNAFYDYDLSRYHSRAGLGAELWRDYLKFGANGYFRLSNWRSAPEMNHDYEARPANGWDIRAEGWLPVYPQLGAKVTLEKYYGKKVALFGKENLQENPHAITAGLNWTPVPLVTLGAERRMGRSDMSETLLGLTLNWTPGVSWSQHLDPDAVRSRRTLSGSRHDLVERNNNIVLEYRKKELIKLSLLERAEGVRGDVFTLVTGLQSKYPLRSIDWSAAEFLAAGGIISGSGRDTRVTLPAWRPGANAEDSLRLNTYIISAVAQDSQGNRSTRKQSRLVVKDTGPQILAGDITASSGARANSQDFNTVTVIVTGSDGRPLSGRRVTFTLPAEVKAVAGASLKVITDSNGVAVLDIVSQVAGRYTVKASVDNGPLMSATTTFTGNTGQAVELRLELSVPVNDAISDGSDYDTVRVVVTDINGAVKANETVTFSVTSGATLSLSEVVTDSNGAAQINLTSLIAGIYTVTATAGGAERTVPVNFVSVELHGTLVVSEPSIPADNSTQSVLTLELKDQKGNPLSGRMVEFISSLTGTSVTGLQDNGDGTYTAKLKGSQAGITTVTVKVNGTLLSGVSEVVTLTTPQPLYTLTANTHLAPYSFAANSGFPTIGFVGATFTLMGVNASDYNWTVQTADGYEASWLNVTSEGVVKFSSRPSATSKSVEIIATPKSGGQPLGYQFTLQHWFISPGNGVRLPPTQANNWCNSQSGGGSLLTRLQVNSGNGRSSGGGVWNQWGNLSIYPENDMLWNIPYLTSDVYNSPAGWMGHFMFIPNSGSTIYYSADLSNGYINDFHFACRQVL